MSGPRHAALRAVRGYLPERILDNEELAPLVGWTPEEILKKTGIAERRISADNECVSDMAIKACRTLFEQDGVDPGSIEFLILCTQTPDHLLPTTACLVHRELGLPTACAAFDINLGCSGYVYALSVAASLIESGRFDRGLVVTADTYTKTIHPNDRSVRTLFGDGASATLLEHSEAPGLEHFAFGTDGTGAENLIIPAGGMRLPHSADTAREETDASGNVRSRDHLFMNGPEIYGFTLVRVPEIIRQVLDRAGLELEAIDRTVFHQASKLVLSQLSMSLGIPPDRFLTHLEQVGNTVSSTIPLTLERALAEGRIESGQRLMLVGFGVGYSWGACTLTWGVGRSR